MTDAERARSMKRSPSWPRVPWLSLRWMTGPRSDLSAALLVGSTPSTVTNVQRAGQILRRLLARPRWYLFFGVNAHRKRAHSAVGS